jgi:hypothetical protein
MNPEDVARCLALLGEVDQIFLANGQGLLAAHLSTVIELLKHIPATALNAAC